MQSASTRGPIEYRFGEWGPAYLMRKESFELGVVALRPGDRMENHLHEHCDESFVVLEGECTLWVDRVERCTMRAGDVFSCDPGEEHYLVNEHDAVCRFVFFKTPPSPGDTVAVAWTPTA